MFPFGPPDWASHPPSLGRLWGYCSLLFSVVRLVSSYEDCNKGGCPALSPIISLFLAAPNCLSSVISHKSFLCVIRSVPVNGCQYEWSKLTYDVILLESLSLCLVKTSSDGKKLSTDVSILDHEITHLVGSKVVATPLVVGSRLLVWLLSSVPFPARCLLFFLYQLSYNCSPWWCHDVILRVWNRFHTNCTGKPVHPSSTGSSITLHASLCSLPSGLQTSGSSSRVHYCSFLPMSLSS